VAYVEEQLREPEHLRAWIQELSHRKEVEIMDELRFRTAGFFERHSRPHWLGGEVVGGYGVSGM